MRPAPRSRLGVLILAALVLAAYAWVTQAFFTSRINGGNDFFSRYIAWRAWLLEGRNPYSDEVTTRIQILIDGRPARPGEDENALIYPWYAVLVQWPFVFMPWSWARAVYIVVCQVLIIAGLGFTARLLEWRLSPPQLALTAVWAVLFYPEGRGIILGQIVITQYFLAVLALWLMRQRRDGWAGICLALTTVRPPPIFMFIPFVLAWALARRRPALAWSFGLTLAALGLAGFLVLPHWLTDWLYRVGRYPNYTVGESPVWLLTHTALPLGDGWTWALSLICAGVMLAAWVYALRQPDSAAFHWALGVTLVVSDLIVPRSATTNYIFLLFPTYLIFAATMRRWPRGGAAVVYAVQLAGLVGLWWLFAATVRGDQEQAIMYLPQPIVIGLVLGLGARWLIRDNRLAGLSL